MFGLYWSFKFSKVKFSTTVGLLHVFPLVRSGSFKKVKFSKTVWSDAGLSSSDEGASHGGEGGRTVSSTAQAYDNFLTPTEPGSGSSKARGGGVLHLSTQSLVLRGTISAK